MNHPIVLLTGLLAFAASTALPAKTVVDEALPRYGKVSGISGNLSSVGSDTLANLMTLWAEEFKRLYPGVNLQIQAAGSSTAPPALTEGTANLGPMSRLMKDNEIGAFEKKRGYKPTPVAVAIDALAVFVHRDNPLAGLTLQQVDAIFSSTLNCGAPERIVRWGQLGLEELGRSAASSSMAAIRCPAPTVTSSSTPCAAGTSATTSTSSRARPRSCRR